jgi:arylsulfatase A-like enzyme
MTTRVICVSLLAALSACATGHDNVVSAAKQKPPHIVFFLADDLGWKDVGFHGSEIQTPNIDALAKTGTRLESFYVQPVCSPTRAAFMTGRYPIRTGLQVGVIRPHAKYGLALDELMLPQVLKRAGYTTAICGKWHLGTLTPEYLPTRRGFDHQYGHYLGAIDYFSRKRNGSVDWNRDDKPLDEEGYTTNLIANESVRLIKSHDTDKPLFLYVAFNAPHSPLQAPKNYLDKYAHIEKKNRRSFAAMVDCLDVAIGKVLAALEARGMRENTLVIFTSDNGGARAADNGPLRARKGSIYEGGTRVPTVVSWPGRVPAGARVDEPLHIVDMLPTLAKLAGGSTKGSKPLDGKDAWGTITRGEPSPHDAILLNTTPRLGAVRAGDWKIVHHRAAKNARRPNRPKGFQLYNLKQDLGEKNDLSKTNPEKLAEMKQRLASFRKAAKKPLGGSGPMPKGTSPNRWGHPDKK